MLQIDGLPGLIMCSGTVVAVGREPFRPATYTAQESPSPTRQHTNRTGSRRLKASNRKFTYKIRLSIEFEAPGLFYLVNETFTDTLLGSVSDQWTF